MSDTVRNPPAPGAKVSVHAGALSVDGTVLETSRFGVFIEYLLPPSTAVQRHWFHPTGTRMGDHDDAPYRFVDRFGAAVALP